MQIFEQLGNRAMHKDRWVAAAFHSPPWAFPRSEDYAHDRWELYHVAEDYSQAHDVAARMYVGRQLVAEKRLAHFGVPTYTNYDGSFDIGRALGSPITSAAQPPFACSGALEQVRVELK